MRVALVHDYLSQDGGAERVLKALNEIWPSAPIFVLFHDPHKIPYFDREKIQQSFLKNFPFISKNFQWYLPLMPLATEKYDLQNFDLIISSASIFSKGIITSPNTLHICYCHTPPRFLWGDGNNYLSDLKKSSFVKIFLPIMMHRMRLWDQMSAQRVDCFIANSQTVAKRIQKYYRRSSDVIFPPVDTHKFFISEKLSDYFVTGGRLVPYKRFDLVIQVFNRLKLPLKIFGAGPEMRYLRRIAKDNIEFYGKISDQEKAELMSRAQAFIHPQREDFGITPIESMASGRPVIAFGEGGAAETVLPDKTGVLFPYQTWESLLHAIINFDPYNWESDKMKIYAENFSVGNFKLKIQEKVMHRLEEFGKGLNQPQLF